VFKNTPTPSISYQLRHPMPNTPINRTLGAPLYWQVYTNLRAAILAGRLKQGTKLPSTRALASELNVSRNTVLNAYEQLLAEGYLESVEATGTFVAAILPDPLLASTPAARTSSSVQSVVAQPVKLSNSGKILAQAPAMSTRTSTTADAGPYQQRAFRAGIPALDAFPFELWAKVVARQARQATGSDLIYQDSAGYLPLREAIASHITITRRVQCTPEQIVIVSGSQGALDLVSRLLLNPGDNVWMEDPGYLGARGALQGAGAQIVPVPVDGEGLIVDAAIAACPDARLAYLTPSHQFPLGVTMSLSRRLAVLGWAKRAGAYILEDDYDSEYRFAGRPLAALQGLDTGNQVIYIGTFSKVLFPSLRLGYLILPPPLVDTFLAARQFIDIHPPLLEQAALASFITEGHFSRHLRHMRDLYAERRALLLAALAKLPLELYASETGMHCIGWLPSKFNDKAFTKRAAAHGVDVTPLSKFSLLPKPRPGLLLGYAGADKAHILEGARNLSAAFKQTGTTG
jgi:GntR family transcriptional regulator / MocR family aminotransferase